MNSVIFSNRDDAARRLAETLKEIELHDPLVLGIPRGGVVTAAVLARELGAELDVALSRKLRAPGQPELAIGAVSEDGEMYLAPSAKLVADVTEQYLEEERRQRMEEIEQRRELFRGIRPPARIADRSVIITDDGIATGSTVLAALHTVRARQPREVIIAVPVGPRERLEDLRDQCDHVVYVEAPSSFMAIGQFYEDFDQVDDETVCDLLRELAPVSGSSG